MEASSGESTKANPPQAVLKTLVIASGNAGKIREFANLLTEFHLEIQPQPGGPCCQPWGLCRPLRGSCAPSCRWSPSGIDQSWPCLAKASAWCHTSA
jgi:hypothetical protein